jgi:hypothetical protein
MPLIRRMTNLFRRSEVNREIDAELQSHIDLRIDENLARGMSREDARRDALVRFGNWTSTRERVTAADGADRPHSDMDSRASSPQCESGPAPARRVRSREPGKWTWE